LLSAVRCAFALRQFHVPFRPLLRAPWQSPLNGASAVVRHFKRAQRVPVVVTAVACSVARLTLPFFALWLPPRMTTPLKRKRTHGAPTSISPAPRANGKSFCFSGCGARRDLHLRKKTGGKGYVYSCDAKGKHASVWCCSGCHSLTGKKERRRLEELVLPLPLPSFTIQKFLLLLNHPPITGVCPHLSHPPPPPHAFSPPLCHRTSGF
jgi:hypothetical protein